MNSNLAFIIYICSIIVIFLIKIFSVIMGYDLMLSEYQINFLLISSVLYLIIFYYMRSFIVNENHNYILIYGFIFIIWYYLVKFISNNISYTDDML